MGFSSDGLPFVGPHPSLSGAVLCLGFTGHGFGLAAEAGRMAASLVLEGRAEDADLFSPRRVL
jgi:glycine/D-amino acid oxidase-like deaminating enzyme